MSTWRLKRAFLRDLQAEAQMSLAMSICTIAALPWPAASIASVVKWALCGWANHAATYSTQYDMKFAQSRSSSSVARLTIHDWVYVLRMRSSRCRS